MTCVGAHAEILEIFKGQICNVYPFNDSYSPMTGIRTVNAAFAYDSEDGQTFILHANQALDFGETMKNSLLCPNQAHLNGVIIDDIPQFLDLSNCSTFSLFFPEQQIRIPLASKFSIAYIPVRKPTQEELSSCLSLDLTSADPWEPELIDSPSLSTSAVHISDPLHDLSTLMRQRVMISSIHHNCGKSMTPADLADLWRIGLKSAASTLNTTTQDYVKILEGPIYRRATTAAHQNRYNQLHGYLSYFCSDTFKSNVKSTRGNTYSQLFCNRGNYTRCYHMKSKSHAHHALDGFLHDIGIPTEMFTDVAKELTLGEWGKKCRKTSHSHCNYRATLPMAKPC